MGTRLEKVNNVLDFLLVSFSNINCCFTFSFLATSTESFSMMTMISSTSLPACMSCGWRASSSACIADTWQMTRSLINMFTLQDAKFNAIVTCDWADCSFSRPVSYLFFAFITSLKRETNLLSSCNLNFNSDRDEILHVKGAYTCFMFSRLLKVEMSSRYEVGVT